MKSCRAVKAVQEPCAHPEHSQKRAHTRSARTGADEPEKVTEATFTFVAIDEHGKPRRLESSQGSNG
jgi:acyl-CoA hydrolase